MTTTIPFPFDFDKAPHFTCALDDHSILHIERVNNSVSKLYLTDLDENLIYMLKELTVHTGDYKDSRTERPVVVVKPSNATYYMLCWSDNYTVTYKNVKKLVIKSQRSWNIQELD